MRQKATFASNTPVSDGAGGLIDHYTPFYTCRGRLRQDSGSRVLESEALGTDQQYEFVCRFTTQLAGQLTAGTQVTINGQIYSLKGWDLVDNINHWYRLTISTLTA